MFNPFRKKTNIQSVTEQKIDQTAQEYIELKVRKRELETQIETLKLDLLNEKKKQDMLLEEERHKQRLVLEEKDAKFERAKGLFEEDKVSHQEKLKREFEIEKKEMVSLLKLDSEQRVKQAELDKSRAIQELEMKHVKDLADAEKKAHEKFYEQMKVELSKMNETGNASTRFMHEMALKLLDKAPLANTFEQRQLTGIVGGKDVREITANVQ